MEKCSYNIKQFIQDCIILGIFLFYENKRKNYKGIVCVLNGGFYLSYYLSKKLDLPLKFIKISSYNKKNKQKAFHIELLPELLDNENYLICDDIYDTGKTIRKIKQLYPKVNLDVCVLVTKKIFKDPYKNNFSYAQEIKKQTWVDFWWEIM